jgi:MerR family transcriptional regulator/heat shock protein HspR
MFQKSRLRRVGEKPDDTSQLPPLRPQQVPLARNQPGSTPRPRPNSQDGPTSLEIEGVYIISVAARILDMHPQTLRKYERLGLVSPNRTVGMLRLYSREDIRKILLIRHLMDHLGLNLAGVEFALNLVDNLYGLRERLSQAAEGTPMQALIEREMSQLFHNLGLPVEESI